MAQRDAYDVAVDISKEGRSRMWKVAFVVAALSILIQVIATAIIVNIVIGHVVSLSNRNLTYTTCVLHIHPDVRKNEDLRDCYEQANALYPDLEPPLPTPVFVEIIEGGQ